MRIIKNNYKKIQKKCRHCGSLLEIDKDDIKYSSYSKYPYFVCPLCKEDNIYYSEEFINDAMKDFYKKCEKLFGKLP